MLKIQNTDDTKCWQENGEQELLFIARENAKWYSHFERQFGSYSSDKLNISI
jgi:hypothetical protein